MPRVLAVANQKGGTGKTTVTVNLAAALASHHGIRTLVVDFDPQMNATLGLVAPPYDFETNVYDLVWDARFMTEIMVPTHHPDLLLVPGSERLWSIERDTDPGEWDRLVHHAYPYLWETVPETVDLVLFDTPPNLGLWLQLALASSDGVVIVSKCESYAVEGIGQLMSTIDQTRESVNPELVIDSVVLNTVRGHTNEHGGFLDEYRKRFGDLILEPVLPLRVVTSSAQRAHTPLEFYQNQDRNAREPAGIYRELAEHFVPEGLEPLRISRAARELVREHGLDPRTIEGTGQEGRILKADAEAAAEAERRGPGAAPPAEHEKAGEETHAGTAGDDGRTAPDDGREAKPGAFERVATGSVP